MGTCLCAFALALITADPAKAQTPEPTPLRFSLDGRVEGPSALFLLPLDRGYYKNESLNVTMDDAANAFEPITRVASGTYDMALADINAVIRFRDQNPTAPIRAIFMVYNRPPFAIVGRKSRGISDPKSLEGKRLGAPPLTATVQQWPVFAKLNEIDASKGDARAHRRCRCGSRCSPPASSTPRSATRSGSLSTSRTAACRSATSSSCRCRTTR